MFQDQPKAAETNTTNNSIHNSLQCCLAQRCHVSLLQQCDSGTLGQMLPIVNRDVNPALPAAGLGGMSGSSASYSLKHLASQSLV